MAETGEGIGDLLTGGIVAREVDRVSGGAGHDASEGAGGECLNCGTVRTGPFCQNCGQSGHIHRNVSALAHDILHGVFHFEGRIWKTLPMLAFHPGKLTRRYVHGERARFVSPMALFLFSVFLLFATVNRLSSPDVAGAAQGLAKAQVQLTTESGKAQERLDRLEKKRIDMLARDPNADLGDLNQKITNAQQEVAGLSVATAHLPARPPGAKEAVAGTAEAMNVNTGVPGFDRQLAQVKDNPALYAYKLKMASYKFSWALIPISVPFIWLMFFWRRDVGLYDHAIFAIHSLSFMTLFVVVLLGLYFVGVPQAPLWSAFLIVPPVHMFAQLRGAYQVGRFGAAWRTVTLLSMTGVTSLLFLLLLLWLEAG